MHRLLVLGHAWCQADHTQVELAARIRRLTGPVALGSIVALMLPPGKAEYLAKEDTAALLAVAQSHHWVHSLLVVRSVIGATIARCDVVRGRQVFCAPRLRAKSVVGGYAGGPAQVTSRARHQFQPNSRLSLHQPSGVLHDRLWRARFAILLKKMATQVGFEPTTLRLTVAATCSGLESYWRDHVVDPAPIWPSHCPRFFTE